MEERLVFLPFRHLDVHAALGMMMYFMTKCFGYMFRSVYTVLFDLLVGEVSCQKFTNEEEYDLVISEFLSHLREDSDTLGFLDTQPKKHCCDNNDSKSPNQCGSLTPLGKESVSMINYFVTINNSPIVVQNPTLGVDETLAGIGCVLNYGHEKPNAHEVSVGTDIEMVDSSTQSPEMDDQKLVEGMSELGHVSLDERLDHAKSVPNFNELDYDVEKSEARPDCNIVQPMVVAGDSLGVRPKPVYLLKIDHYDGERGDKADIFIRKFVNFSFLDGFSQPEDWKLLFPLYLIGEAREWYNNIENFENHSLDSWDALVKAFLNEFSPTMNVTVACYHLVTMKQCENESVSGYAHRYSWFVQKHISMCGLPTELILDSFVSGLQAHMQNHVRQEHPADLDDAVRIAMVYEDAVADTRVSTFYNSHVMLPLPIDPRICTNLDIEADHSQCSGCPAHCTKLEDPRALNASIPVIETWKWKPRAKQKS